MGVYSPGAISMGFPLLGAEPSPPLFVEMAEVDEES